MIIVFNWIGAGILLSGFAAGTLISLALHTKSGLPFTLVAGLLVVALDLLYRLKIGEGCFFHPRRGGHVFFIPAWILGCGYLVAGGFSILDPDDLRASLTSNGKPTQAVPAKPGAAGTSTNFQVPPRPSYNTLKVAMISGAPQHRMATINGETFIEGETHRLSVGTNRITLQCLEIREESVLAKVAGESRARELKLGPAFPPATNL